MAGDGSASGTVGVRNLPDAVRAAAALHDADYADLTVLTTPHARAGSPEEWLRAMLEQGAIGRHAAPRLWRALGLRLSPAGSAGHVQGWRIAGRGEDWIRIRTASWYMTAEAVLNVDDAHVSLALLLRYDRPVAPAVWAVVGPGHRRGVPRMLLQALAIRRAAHQP